MPETLLSNLDWQIRLEPVYRLYAALARGLDPEAGLGGKLLYAGELHAGESHQDGGRLVRAANIAGAASLSASADAAAQRQAIRDGVADFLVTSLDEALRILKNEVRKRQTVAVAVSISPSEMFGEMLERGVLPDLLPPAGWNGEDARVAQFVAQGARPLALDVESGGAAFRVWESAPSDFEALALSLIPEADRANRRWLRLSPRYLVSTARRVRSLACTAEVAERLEELLAGSGKF